MRILLALAVLVSPFVISAPHAFVCPKGQVAEGAKGYTACKVARFAPATPEDLVLTAPTSSPTWRTFSRVAGTTEVRSCPSENTNADDEAECTRTQWVPKSTVAVKAPPNPEAPLTPFAWLSPSLIWQPVTQSQDGKPASISGYRVYHGTVPGKYDATPITVVGPRYSLATLGPGTHYFAVSAVSGPNESPKSAEVAVTGPPSTTVPPVSKVICTTTVVTEQKSVVTCEAQ